MVIVLGLLSVFILGLIYGLDERIKALEQSERRDKLGEKCGKERETWREDLFE